MLKSRATPPAQSKSRRTRGRANRAPMQPGELSDHPFARVSAPAAARGVYRLGARRAAGKA